MFRFADPEYFLLLVPAAAALLFVYRKRVANGLIFAATSRLPRARTTWRIRLARFLPFVTITGIILAITALARPRTVLSSVRQSTDAIAIEMVVDVSGSMEALDLSSKTATGHDYRSRLDVVKDIFTEFIGKRPDDLIGLVTFGGYASTRAPLTIDHEALLHVLEGVEIPKTEIGRNGNIVNQEETMTAIGDGLATACARMEKAEPVSKIIILLSDGESNTGIIQPSRAVAIARELGIKVYTIGVGSRSGMAPFAVKDLFGQTRIRNMEAVLDEQTLKSIADETGGRYFHVNDRKGLEEALADIDKLEKTEIERSVYEQYDELFARCLFPAMLLILLGTSLNMAFSKRVI